MRPSDRDASYIYDMIDAARSVQAMAGSVALAEFVAERKLYRAIEREIEIIGEAANRLSETLKLAHPEIPWTKIIGTRHRLAHEYDQIRLEIIYRIAVTHIPDMLPQLESIHSSLGGQMP